MLYFPNIPLLTTRNFKPCGFFVREVHPHGEDVVKQRLGQVKQRMMPPAKAGSKYISGAYEPRKNTLPLCASPCPMIDAPRLCRVADVKWLAAINSCEG